MCMLPELHLCYAVVSAASSPLQGAAVYSGSSFCLDLWPVLL